MNCKFLNNTLDCSLELNFCMCLSCFFFNTFNVSVLQKFLINSDGASNPRRSKQAMWIGILKTGDAKQKLTPLEKADLALTISRSKICLLYA